MGPTCHSLSLSSPCFSLCRTVRGMALGGLTKLPRCALPSWRTIPFSRPVSSPSRPRRLPELATCLTSLCDSSSSSPPPSVRHERLVKQLALAGPIRKLFSMDPKSVGDMPKSPSSQYGLKAQEDINPKGIMITNSPMR